MMITITPVRFEIPVNLRLSGQNNEEKKQERTIVYWGTYLNDKQISYTSSKEQAEETKLWMEKWFKGEIQRRENKYGKE